MDGTFERVVNDLISRIDGPLHFRIILQPLMATVFAVRDGLRDARNGEPAYFWSLFTDSHLRPTLIRNGWKSIARIFFLAVVLDAIYQVIVVRWFYPFETLIVAIGLALFPYALLRGLVNRVARALSGSGATRRSSTVSGGESSGGRFSKYGTDENVSEVSLSIMGLQICEGGAKLCAG